MRNERTKADEKLEEAVGKALENWKLTVPIFLVVLLVIGYWQKDLWLTARREKMILDTISEVGGFLFWIGFVFVLLIVSRAIFVHFWNKRRFTYLQIIPHADDGVKPDSLGEMIRRFHGSKRKPLERLVFGKEWFSFVVHMRRHSSKGNQYVFYLGADQGKIDALKTHLSSLYSRSEFYPAEDIAFPSEKAVGGRMKIKRKKLEVNLSLASYKYDQLPGVFNSMKPDTWMQITFSPNDGWKLRRSILKAEEEIRQKKAKDRNAFESEEIRSYFSRFSGNEVAFDVLVSIAADHQNGVSTLKNVGNALAAVMADVNEIRYRRWRRSVTYFPQKMPYQMVWTGSELANLFHLPHFNGSGLIEKLSKDIPHLSRGLQSLPYNVLSNPLGISFGTMVHPIIDNREVNIMPDVLTKHWGLTGKTGSGKSTLLNHIFKSFADKFMNEKEASGFSFIDPALETAEIILNYLLKAEKEGKEINWDKVHWINFKNSNNPLGMNLLYQMEGESDAFVVDQIMRVIRESEFAVAPQAERMLKRCIATLVADKGQNHTILGIRPLLLDPKFRRAVLARLERDPKNQDIISFWEDEAPDMIDTSKHAILNRLDIFYSNDFLRRLFGQSSFGLPIRKWMDEGHIIFYNFSGMSEEETGLIGSYLTYLYYRIADTRPPKSLMHQFCIDEAQRVPATILPEIIKEMRKKGLILGISTQELDSLPVPLQKALVNIAGNMFVCEQGPPGAKVAAEAFKVTINDKDVYTLSEAFLRNLPTRRCAIKTRDNFNGIEQSVNAVVDVPPLDRYKPDGSVAHFDDPEQLRESTAWTLSKAAELESKNGLSTQEIDQAISNYLNGTPVEEEIVSNLDVKEDQSDDSQSISSTNDDFQFVPEVDESKNKKEGSDQKEAEWSFME